MSLMTLCMAVEVGALADHLHRLALMVEEAVGEVHPGEWNSWRVE